MDSSLLGRIREGVGEWEEGHLQEYLSHDWNLHRWITAYEGNEEETIKVSFLSLLSLP